MPGRSDAGRHLSFDLGSLRAFYAQAGRRPANLVRLMLERIDRTGDPAVWIHRLSEESVLEYSGMKVREVVRLLLRDGWYRIPSRGGHRQYKHAFKRGRATVPGQMDAELDKKTEKSILKQAGLKK